ncbi:hypothetical protein [Streptomyces sp. MB09-02B]|uniref:hypothetical protein n=1 Tax=Streptomyces sp. MB09-02B TaxID=3028667 RepID=UPI0029BB5D10|nr:hypothetical protein [Streptomyces sp. MB09-02B]MDX3638527.1 hypothetical protein [Streptomyces sp. MB09-02B]
MEPRRHKPVNRANGMVADSWGATDNGAACRRLARNGHTDQQRTVSPLRTIPQPMSRCGAVPRPVLVPDDLTLQ